MALKVGALPTLNVPVSWGLCLFFPFWLARAGKGGMETSLGETTSPTIVTDGRRGFSVTLPLFPSSQRGGEEVIKEVGLVSIDNN